MEQIQGAVQKYEWGKRGSDSLVAQLSGNTGNEGNYAELWMGTHTKGMATVVQTGESLSSYLSARPALLGETLQKRWPSSSSGQLPYLFKVLSVRLALSIQAHPDLTNARVLHARDPANYPDANHKPEMVIAVSDFEALCGFRASDELRMLLKASPELRVAVGESAAETFLGMTAAPAGQPDAGIQYLFAALMNAPLDRIHSSLGLLRERLSSGGGSEDSTVGHVEALALRLMEQFPGDVGCLVAYFLNYCLLRPGDALFLGPNEPHAYLYGDCLECMACSDNTIRAGLTPKFKDVPTLLAMLTYVCGVPELVHPVDVPRPQGGAVERQYRVPVPDFFVSTLKIAPGSCSTFSTLPTPWIAFVLRGSGSVHGGSSIGPGSTFLVGAGEELLLCAGLDESLELWRASVGDQPL